MSLQYTDQWLDSMRQIGDTAADETVKMLFESGQAKAFWQLVPQIGTNASPLPNGLPDAALAFFEQTAELPKWADRRRLKAGQEFYAKRSADVMLMLGVMSLPYCYAAESGVKVLYASERMRHDASKRLAETGMFVFDVLAADAFGPTGKGLRSIQKVRLMHAAVRYHLQKHGGWDVGQNGLPVNQEDMAGTNLAFSHIVLRGLRNSGATVSPQEAEDYLHYWRVVGYLNGIQEELLPKNALECTRLGQKIEQRHFRSCPEGRELTQSLLDSFKEQAGANLPDSYFSDFMRMQLGDRVADILGLAPASWTTKVLKSVRNLSVFNRVMGELTSQRPARQLAATKARIVRQQSAGRFTGQPSGKVAAN